MSRYWQKTWFALSDSEAIDILLREFRSEKEKPVLVPSSDGVAYEIDIRLNELKRYFITPSIKDKQGEIARLMDKKNQTEWAHQLGLKTAKTWCVELNEQLEAFYKEVVFPCIAKPVISSEGHKTDITKCESIESLKILLTKLHDKGFSRKITKRNFLAVSVNIQIAYHIFFPST